MMREFDQPLSSHMVAPVHTILLTEPVAGAACALEALGVSALPVVDGSRRLAGMLERADLMRVGRLRSRAAGDQPRWSWPDLRVSECMQTAVPVAPPGQPLRQCALRMFERRLQRVYVLDDEQLVGVISTRELMLAVASARVDTPIGKLAIRAATTIAAQAPVSLASGRLAAAAGEPLVVLDGTTPVGVFAAPELRACLEADPAQHTSAYMDRSLVALPSERAAEQAAREAAAARARYIIAIDAALGYRVVSGRCFAACVCGSAQGLDIGAAAAALSAPALSMGGHHLGAAQAAGTCPEAALPRPSVDPLRSAEPNASSDAPAREPRQHAPSPPRRRD